MIREKDGGNVSESKENGVTPTVGVDPSLTKETETGSNNGN